VLAIAALALCAASAWAQNFSTPKDISGDMPGGQPLIAVDSKNNIDIAWSTSKGVFFTRSTDAGKTFGTPATISAGAGSGDLQMNVDASGNIYLLWQGADSHLLLRRSTDAGSFSSPIDLTATLQMGTLPAAPMMALDKGGNINLVWAELGSTGAVMFVRSTDGGTTFSRPVGIGKFVYGAGTQIAAGPQGDINVLWSEQTTEAGDACALHFNRSTDSGATFSPTMTVNSAEAGCDAKLLVDSEGTIHVVAFEGTGTYYRSVDGGKTFSNSQNILQPTIMSLGGQFHVDSQGNLKTVASSFANHDILFSKSSDRGTTFARPMVVGASHPSATSGGSLGANNESMAVDPSGNVNLLWQDDVLRPGAADIFFSRSTDGGASFSNAQNVSRSPGSGSPQMAVDLAGNVNIVWSAGADRKVLFTRASADTAGSGFTISATPASLMALPGGSATAQVTLTATGVFNEAVSLSCSNLPAGAQCLFNPASVTPSKSGSTVGVVVTIPPTLSTGGFPFTLNVASPTISQFQDMQISVGLLTGSVTPTATTISVGASASFQVTVASTGGFGGQLGLTCSAPAGVTCTFSPTSTTLPVNGRATAILTMKVVNTPATGSVSKNPRDVFPRELPPTQKVLPILGFLLLLLSALGFSWVRRREGGELVLARTAASICVSAGLTLALATIMVSCSGGRSKDTLGSGGVTVGTGGAAGIPGGTTTGAFGTVGNTSVTFPVGVVAQAGASAVNIGTVTVTVP
jgi:hypothetical protein